MRLNHVTVPALDLAASIAFYQRLDLRLIVRADHYARFELPEGGATFSLELAKEAAAAHAPVAYFECDVDAEHARLTAEGVPFDSAPETKTWLWREAHLRDPAGNRLILYSAGPIRRFPPWRLHEASGAENFHIVLMRAGDMLVVRRSNTDWRALQDEFPDYMTSLGPYTLASVLEMIQLEWPDVYAARADAIIAFAESDASELKV